MNAGMRSIRPARELVEGGEAARRAFGALVAHLGGRYRYFPDFARLEGEALAQALVARAEALCRQLVDPPARIAALGAYGWGRFDRWIRGHLTAAGATLPPGGVDEHAGHRVAQEMVLALAEDQQLALTGGVEASPRPIPTGLESELAKVARGDQTAPAVWDLCIVSGAAGVASWALIVAVGERLEGILVHDGAQLVAPDEVLIGAEQGGVGEPLVVAPWCRFEITADRLECCVTSLAPFALPDPLPPTSQAQAELRRVLGRVTRPASRERRP